MKETTVSPGRRRLSITLLSLFVLLFAGLDSWLHSDSWTLTTYYPSPSGLYRRLASTEQTLLATQGGSVGIGTSSPRAKLDVQSSDSGFLPPRLSAAQRDAIPAPPAGSLLFNTSSSRLEYFDGARWVSARPRLRIFFTRLGGYASGDDVCRYAYAGAQCVSAGHGFDSYKFCGTSMYGLGSAEYQSAGAYCAILE